MTAWKRFGLSTAITLLLASGLTGCAHSLKRPVTAPTPPLVDCGRSRAAQIPAIPELSDMDVWALQVMGLYQVEVTKRISEDECLAELRRKGVTR